jgi:hypothetical protein
MAAFSCYIVNTIAAVAATATATAATGMPIEDIG